MFVENYRELFIFIYIFFFVLGMMDIVLGGIMGVFKYDVIMVIDMIDKYKGRIFLESNFFRNISSDGNVKNGILLSFDL